MVEEIVNLKLSVPINVKELEDLILKELKIPKEDAQIIKVKKTEI